PGPAADSEQHRSLPCQHGHAGLHCPAHQSNTKQHVYIVKYIQTQHTM
ncbi:unnamed protein product, partial [Staurois parvus]